MAQPVSVLASAAAGVVGVPSLGAPDTNSLASASPSFVATLDHALEQVSQADATARGDARDVVMGAPGASLETALIASMRANIEWTAAVAVRNGVVNAYNTIINMPV